MIKRETKHISNFETGVQNADKIATILSIIVAIFGFVVFFGWLFEIDILRRIHLGIGNSESEYCTGFCVQWSVFILT